MSRSSSASCRPVLAPEGTIARPTAPVEAIASTSTVGRPRESSTWRAFSAFKVVMPFPCRSRFRGPCSRSSHVAGSVAKCLAAERPRDRLTAGVEIFDRALAVDPGQAAGRRVQDGSTDQLGPRGRVDASPIQIGAPEKRSQPGVSRGQAAIVAARTDRLEQKMAQEEPEVERRVARVGALEVEQDQAAASARGCSSG